jgi:hypothetical protein
MEAQAERFVIVLPRLLAGLNGDKGLKRQHFYDYRKDLIVLQWELKAMRIPCFIGKKVSIVYERHETHPMDWDNHCASFKMIGDALVKLRILDDDSPEIIKTFTPAKKKVHRDSEIKTIVIIEVIQ